MHQEWAWRRVTRVSGRGVCPEGLWPTLEVALSVRPLALALGEPKPSRASAQLGEEKAARSKSFASASHLGDERSEVSSRGGAAADGLLRQNSVELLAAEGERPGPPLRC
jgi:hypothetical protein